MAPIPTYKHLPDSVQHDAEKQNDLETGLSQYDEAGVTQDRQKSRKRCGYWRRTVLAVIASLAFLHFGMTLLSLASRSIAFNGAIRHVCGGARRLSTHYKLPSGDKIPSVALGVWRAPQNDVGPAVAAALKAGYRHIDGAWIYGNEKEVGEALKHSGVTRRDVWLTSKLWNSFHAPEKVEKTLDETLSSLGTDYLDLYLIHWPVAFNEDGSTNLELSDNPYPTWQKLEEMVEKGKIRNIGVSNFNIRRLQNLTANPLKIRPAVNQVELSFWNPQPELLKWSRENNILVEAYSPLGSAERVKDSLNVPEIKEISEELGITPAQVIISWHVQRGTVVLPKSVHPERVIENFQVTKLPQASFDKLEKAATSHKPERGNDPSKKWGIDIFN